MNVSCTSCSAKYALPDEKVRGKKVKITCKHCGTGIIVDGTKLDGASEAPAGGSAAPTAMAAPVAMPEAPAPAPAAARPAAAVPKLADAAEPSFDIAYADDRQETLRLSEIVDKYAAGTLDDEAFLWREGMSDWKAPFDIPEIAGALGARGLKQKPAAPPASDETQVPTPAEPSPFDAFETGSNRQSEWREPAKETQSSPEAAFDLRAPSALPFEKPEPFANPKPAGVSPKPVAVAVAPAKQEPAKPAAARRNAARGGGDLFGDLAGAGSEEDDSLGSQTKDAAPKMTGARNESSVLFSLDALVKQEQKPAAKKSYAKQQDDAAAILMGTDSGPSSLANVGTGSFGSAFAAPDFNAPVIAPPVETRASDPVELPSAASSKKKGMGLWIGIAAVVALAGGAIATGLPAKLAGAPPAAQTPSATAAATKPEVAPTPAPDSAPATSATAAPTTPPATASAPAMTPAPAAAKPGEVAKPADKPSEAAKPSDRPVETAKPTEKPADKPAAAAADTSSAPPFDKAAAIAALSAAAGNAQSCKTPDGPTGGGKVSITFMPSGRATNTSVSGDLAGTAVGGCVARLFRSTKVPPFSGDAVTVSKSFSVQ